MRALLLSFVLVLTGGPAAAVIDCRIADFATRLMTLQLDVLSNMDTPGPHLAKLAAALSDWSGEIEQQADDDRSTADLGAISALTRLSYSLVWTNGSPEKLATILFRSDVSRVRRGANVAILRAACATSTGTLTAKDTTLKLTEVAVEHSGDAESAPAVEPTPGPDRPRRFILPTVALGTAAIVLSGLVVIRQVLRLKGLRHRRKRRYSLNCPIAFRGGGSRARGRLIDINCYGLKLRHSGQLADVPTAEIELHGEWRPIRIVWHNAHYAGATFVTPLRPSRLLFFVAGTAALPVRAGRPAVT